MSSSSLHNKPSKLGTITSHRSEVSSASRFYDNGADTSSSLSDNSYIDNQVIINNNNKHHHSNTTITNKVAYSQVLPPAPIGFKLPSQTSLVNSSPTKAVIPPPVHQRSLSKKRFDFR